MRERMMISRPAPRPREKLNEIPGRQLTPDGKAPMPGRPAHLPENYLLNAELNKEAQTGNYNMLDGRLDNLAPEKAGSDRRPDP